MARKKPANVALVKDLAGADAALGEIAELQRHVASIGVEMNRMIDRAKKDAEKNAAPLLQRIAALENGLQVFAEQSKKTLFDKTRSIVLGFGAFGFRKSTKLRLMPGFTWKRVLEELEAEEEEQYIIVKKKVNKETLRIAPDDDLEAFGVRRAQNDAFWYEIKSEELKNAGD